VGSSEICPYHVLYRGLIHAVFQVLCTNGESTDICERSRQPKDAFARF